PGSLKVTAATKAVVQLGVASGGSLSLSESSDEGDFSNISRVRRFKASLRSAAAHASKMRMAYAKRELNLEGLVKGCDGMEAGVLTKSTNP
ncbi:unnamed protein product, partial [Discosporangium mesarthrocarpum]